MIRNSIIASLLLLSSAVTATAGVTLPYVNGCEDLSTVATTPNGSKAWSCEDKQEFRLQRANASTPHSGAVFFPTVDFQVGKTYRIEVTARHGQRNEEGSYKVWLANGTANSSFVTPALAVENDVKGWFYHKRTYFYTPSASGSYRVAVQATSPASCEYFYLTEFAISECDSALPGAPTAVSVTPDASGLKSATVSVTAPSVSVSGGALSSAMSSLDVYWGDKLMSSIPSPVAGQKYTTTFDVGQPRPYILTLSTTDASGRRGGTALADVTIGQTLPQWSIIYGIQGTGMRHKYRATFSPATGVTLTLDPTLATANDGGYTVTRMPDGAVIASGSNTADIADPNFPLSSRLSYYYKVTFTDTQGEAKSYDSTVISLNNKAPFYVDFSDRSVSSDNTYAEFTFDDAGKDGNCFVANQNGYMSCYNRNDWLITPGVNLEAGKQYRFSAGLGSSSSATAGAEVWLGKANVVDSFTTPVMPLTQVSSRDKAAQYDSYFTVDADGTYFFGLHVLNTETDNSYQSLLLYNLGVEEVSEDLPGICTDLKVSYTSATEGTLSFTASPRNVAGRPQQSLTEIVVERDGSHFATLTNPMPGGQCSVPITVENGKSYLYKVTPYNRNGAGVSAELMVGLITPPYSNDFVAANALEGFTVLDGHNDGFTWHIFNGEARCYPGDNGLDDILVTPAITLQAGSWYKVQVDTHNTTSPPAKDNTVSLRLGNEPTYEALSETIISPYNVPLSGKGVMKEYFTVAETGQYYLGWHAYNEDRYATPVFLNNFTLSEPIKGTVPGAGKLVVTPDPQGALKATVNITLPTTDLAGNELQALTRADLYIDGVLYKNFRKSLGAESFDVVIENMTEGAHRFMLYCRNGDGQGREYEVDAYIGINSPGDPVNLRVERTQQEGEVTISWEAPEVDHDGYPINNDWLSYEVYVYNSNATSQAELEQIVCSSTKNLSFTYQALPADAPQEFIRFGVRAMTIKGTSHGVVASSIPVGKPYSLPYNDSFVNRLPEKIYRHVTLDTNNVATWGSNDQEPSGVFSYDNDNGLGMMLAYWTGGSAALGSARIALDCDNPMFSMFVYNYSTPTLRDDNIMGLYVRPDGGDWTKVAEKSISAWTDNTPGWQKITVDLSEYAHRNVEIAFRGETVSHVYMLIDRITVRPASSADMTIGGIILPEEAFVGCEVPITVSVKNNGTAAATGKKVDLYRNNELLDSKEVDFEAGERIGLMFTDTITRPMAAESLDYVYYARVDASGENEFNAFDNRSADKQLPLVDNSTYPTISALDGHQKDGAIELTWNAPIISDTPEIVTDDFESYPSWANQATGIGGYRLDDRDRLGVLAWEDVQWPIAFQSFQSFFLADFSDPSLTEIRAQAPGLFEAHSGNKALMSLSPADPDAYVNDVIISPLLGNGDKQLSLWAKAFSDSYPESFEVRYSTTNTEYSSFSTCAYFSGVPGTWTEYSCTIPADAKYFAIVRNNYGTVCLFIDDMTYTPAGNERLVVEGYNIYRDGTEVAHAYNPEDVMAYIDDVQLIGRINYDVTVLYNRGESPAVSTVVYLSDVDKVTTLKPNATGVAEGIHITRAANLPVNVYSLDGSHLATTVGHEDMVFSIATGFYIVTIGNETFKVIVP